MTNQSHQTNGASLEDCHTNFFALTELYGIKWRKLVWGESTEDGTAPLADPVISSYARCLAGDILCVWRRVPATPADPYEPSVPPPLSLRAAKELWIFWYGEEPDLNGLVAPELIASQGEQGSWDSGLSYECRSLLFKALHNLIERCLLSRDFVRLGKWFVQPYDGDEEDVGKSPWHLSFSFAFFLHGESTVCASVDVRQHPAVRTLTKRRLAALKEHATKTHKVILAPFGLEGAVTGREWSDADPATGRLLDSWRQLYPLEQGCSALEVVCGGVRMRYPSPYVLETEEESGPAPPRAAPPLAPRAFTHLATNHTSSEIVNGDPLNDKFEDFIDPTRKTPCTCAKSGAGCSPMSLGGGSPAPPSAPSSARAVSASPSHPATTTHLQNVVAPPACLSTPAPTPDPHTPAPSAANHKYNQSESPSNTTSGADEEGVSRPVLPPPPRRTHCLDDDHELHMLYDYTTVHAWLEHPVKRFKAEGAQFEEQMALGASEVNDLYQGHHHTKMAATPLRAPTLLNEKQEEDNKEYNKSLFTSDGLCVTSKDLDQIFDNSDEASGDETSLVASLSLEGACRWETGRGRPKMEELSKMFPTPPSMEPSPGAITDDTHLTHDSPTHDTIEDWSYVFKPPQVCKYVGSMKYSPLSTLPSQLLPPVTLPPTAVYRPRWQHDKPAHTTDTERPRETGRSTSGVTNTTGGGGGVTAVTRSPSPPLSPISAACPLTLNVLLADTLLNLFRDHNFDSCTLCVCHPGGKTVVGNIRGADAALYLHGAGAGSGWCTNEEDDPSRCQCGFSAVVNRRRAHRAGLFYEDELEITGLPYNVGAGSQGRLCGVAAAAAAAACCVPGGAACSLSRHPANAARNQHHEPQINLLEYNDGGWCGWLGLRAAGGTPSSPPTAVHRWPFLRAHGPRSSRDVVRLMRRLRPLLQDAIQKRCCGARMWDGVSGPLTWRQFHRLAGRGNEDLCEPQPVPPLLVGHDRDWVSLSPYALKHWDQLALEPYSYCRDLAYLVIAPDSELLTEPLKLFFRELTTAYEACRLGRHQPINRIAKDGIIRTGPSDRDSDNNDEWTGEIPPGRLGEYIKAYAEVLKSLVNQLSTFTIDESIFTGESNKSHIERPTPSPMRPPSTPDHPPTPSSQSDQEDANTNNTSSNNTHNSNVHLGTVSSSQYWGSERGEAGLVVYLVEPPGGAAALAPLLRLATAVSQRLSHHAPLVKIISVEGVMEWMGVGGAGCGAGAGALRAGLRALAFSVFTGSRRLLHHSPDGKSLTGFGTAANAHLFLSNKDEKNRAGYRLYCPAWVLAGARGGRGARDGGEWGTVGGECGVLFLAYCLSHDQRWLLAAATDQRGELLDTAVINIHVSHRSRRRRAAPARRLGLTKLMDFTLGVMSQSAQPWRLVVGRVGRIGHGELKGWSWLLSRKNLSRASNVLRDICGSCSMFYSSGVPKDFGVVTVPCILSACLVSTEPEPCLRLMADRFTPDERFSQASIQSHLHTPRDVTATHILVFPTSATTQSNQMPYEPPMANGEDSDMLLFEMPEDDIGDMGEDNMTDLLMGEMLTMFAPNSPRRHDDDQAGSRDGSPARQPSHGHSNFNGGNDDADAVGSVLQQPLALGYLVSTAPLGGMPGWWWAGSGHLRDSCPAFIRSALHLHAGTLQAPDDLTFSHQRHHTHPLDSQITTDVLRYVLESYNALSWLALDDKTHDRQSCLPLHVQVLMQLYHTAATLS